MALTKILAAGLTADLIDETKLADNSIDSEHYNDGSIDNAHLADDAVGIAELSATGTASSSTFLRGDNSWVTPTDTNTQLTEEQVEDFVGGMVTGNTETGITVTYQDSDGTLDFVVDDTTKLPLAGGTITGDVVFTGDSANVTWDKSEDDLTFADNARIKFGTGLDLHMYHNGTNSVIREEGEGNLNIQTTGGNVEILANTTEDSAKFISNGSVELYFDDSKKFHTHSTGATITGYLHFADGAGTVSGLGIGNSDDFRILHNSNTNWLELHNDNALKITKGANTELIAKFTPDDSVELYHNDGKRFETTQSGVTITGIIDNTDAQGNTRIGSAAGDSFSGTDAVDNTLIGKDAGTAITTGDYNVAVGKDAMQSTTTAARTTAVGKSALQSNTTGGNNVAVGQDAMQANTTGGDNVAVGKSSLANNTTAINNTAVGRDALNANTTGEQNAAFGKGALALNTTSNNNSALGYHTLDANTTGANNTAVGSAALTTNTTASDNTAIGKSALEATTTGQENVSIGVSSGKANTTGRSNVAIGREAFLSNTTGSYNTAVGYESLRANTTAAYNVAVGIDSLKANTTGDRNVAIGKGAMETNTVSDRNTAVGVGALATYNPGSNEDGYNTAVGYNAGAGQATNIENTLIGSFAGNGVTGNANTAIGYGSLNNTASGAGTVAIGKGVLDACTDPDGNVGIGYYAASDVTTGEKNTIIGYTAGRNTTTGAKNVALGFNALYDNTTGEYNVALGPEAGYDITTGSNSVCIGREAGKGQLTTDSSRLYIARDNVAHGNDQVWLYGSDDGGCYQGNNQTAWNQTSDQRLKKDIVDNNVGLSVLDNVKVRNFKYKQYNRDSDGNYSTPVTTDDTIDLSTFPSGVTAHNIVLCQGHTETQIGVIAQELEAICPGCVDTDSSTGAKTVNTDDLFWHMVNAIKELSAKVKALEAA